MAFSRSEIERLADDQYQGRTIHGSVYCGNCGYNLRTLPYVYTCPECGSGYNARPLQMKGIFQPHDAKIPFGDMATVLFCGASAVLLSARAINTARPEILAFGVALGVLTVIFWYRTVAEFRKLAKNRAIAKRLELESG